MGESDEALIADPVAAWDAVADLWDDFVETGLDYWRTGVHGPALLAACGDPSGQRALDLGCGQGWFSLQLAMTGARVWAVDMSSRLAQHWCTPQWHRTPEEWSALIEAAGLCTTRLVGPRSTPAQIVANPGLGPASRIPYFLVLTLRRLDRVPPARED